MRSRLSATTCRVLGLCLALAAVAVHGAARAGDAGGKEEKVTSFYQGKDGAFVMVMNNDLHDLTFDVNVDKGVFFLHNLPTDGGAFTLTAGGALPIYVPAKTYTLRWNGTGTGKVPTAAGKTTTLAFEPTGADSSGLRALVNDGSGSVTVDMVAGTAAPAAPAAQTAPATSGGDTVVVEQAPATVYYVESSPVVDAVDVYVPDPPWVTFTAGFITGAVTSAVFWDHYMPPPYPYPYHPWGPPGPPPPPPGPGPHPPGPPPGPGPHPPGPGPGPGPHPPGPGPGPGPHPPGPGPGPGPHPPGPGPGPHPGGGGHPMPPGPGPHPGGGGQPVPPGPGPHPGGGGQPGPHPGGGGHPMPPAPTPGGGGHPTPPAGWGGGTHPSAQTMHVPSAPSVPFHQSLPRNDGFQAARPSSSFADRPHSNLSPPVNFGGGGGGGFHGGGGEFHGGGGGGFHGGGGGGFRGGGGGFHGGGGFLRR